MLNKYLIKMKKFITLVFMMLFVSIGYAIAQDGQTIENEPLFDKIMTWVTAVGIPGILLILFRVWKAGPALIGKIGAAAYIILDELINLIIQAKEVPVAINTVATKLKTYAADGNYTKEELEDIVKSLKLIADEANDVSVALKSLKDKFRDVVQNWKK
jgi:hypothetical protein